jgi:hypothetical protein
LDPFPVPQEKRAGSGRRWPQVAGKSGGGGSLPSSWSTAAGGGFERKRAALEVKSTRGLQRSSILAPPTGILDGSRPHRSFAEVIKSSLFSSLTAGHPSTAAERRRAKDRSPPPRLHSPRYLAAVKGKCFKCLSSSHRRVDCRLPTCCFNCFGYRHHLQDCKRPRRSPAALGGSHACAVDASQCVVRASRDISCSRPTSQALRGTFLSLGDGGTSGALALATFAASDFLEPDLISVSSVCFTPHSWDPMVEEAALKATVGAPLHSY